MVITQILGSNDSVQIGLEQLLNHVDLFKLVKRFGLANVENGDQLVECKWGISEM